MSKGMLEADNGYDIPNRRIEGRCCKTNIPSNTAFRGFGYPQTNAVLETAITQVASFLDLPAEKVSPLLAAFIYVINRDKHSGSHLYSLALVLLSSS